MKKFALIAGIALLASCGSKTERVPDTAATDAMMPMDSGTTPTAEATTSAGSYDVTNPDGSKGTTTIMADGTYVDRDAKDKVIAKGTWADKNGKTCFTAEGKLEECYSEGPAGANGNFTATGPDGKVTQVKPHAKK